MKRIPKALFALLLSTTLFVAAPTEACTRAVYQGPAGRVLTGRSMDWKLEILSNLWIFPRGMERSGVAGPTSMRWTSKYGSVVVSGYNIATVDGMNEPGLVVNALWLAVSKYPENDGRTPRLSLSIWAQYFLDNFATVTEAVEHLRANPFHVGAGEVPGQPGRLATIHLSLSDATGDSAILEWVDGELQIHHSRDYQVMTNEPVFAEQLAITSYWQQIDGLSFLPGTSRATDRFARASFYINAIPQTDDPRIAAASVFSVMRNVSVPYGISVSDQPNLSTTRWRVVADHKDKLYYFESAISPNVFWVDLKKVDFSPGSGVRTLDLGDRQQVIFSGEVSSQFVAAEPFAFQPSD
ncbi:linear amide C-N hydrolase [Thermoleptolyngbya sp. C42_A2020_037]|uniref:linear amide C-N hydrolase n=1 Tax=Thermoleptolyngbya sp. C42_A2020_037 TaxID=2747799 RepID=UPI001A0AE38F|nr:linear amide C-N hydrolase [Thermoleptolyngbya sp. C42_A2020_037]MBF2083142.1 linear amide C-N hydrolase [Thermoleptolyngbya sp. C42_A2020_037]